MLIGLYANILENNNQFTLPADFQEAFRQGYYIMQGFDKNIMALTPQAFEAVYQKVTSLNLTDPLARLLVRMLLGSTSKLAGTVDGKMIVPEMLMAFADINKELVIVGQGDFIEIWSPAMWTTQAQQLRQVEANHFSSLYISSR